MEQLTASTVGAQIVLEVGLGDQIGQAAVHWEQNGHAGLSRPVWAEGREHEIARLAAARLRAAAAAIEAQLPAEG